jgi:transcriptional regulator with XRE-family HTH domain
VLKKGFAMAVKFGGNKVGSTHFKKSKRFVVNRYLYGLMHVENVTIADLSNYVGVSRYTVREWIFNGRVPKNQEVVNKVCEKLDCPATILFNEAELYFRKGIQ